MAFSIKNDETDALLRELTELTGESLTEAVTRSVRERLGRRRRLVEIAGLSPLEAAVARFRALPVLDARTDDEILGYDAYGLAT